MKNNKKRIIAVAILLIVIVAIVVIVKNNNTDVVESTTIESALNTTSTPTSTTGAEAENIDEFISNIDVVPEQGEQEEMITLSTEEVIFEESVIEKKSEPTVAPTEVPEEKVEPTKTVEPTKAPEKEEIKVTPAPTKKPENEEKATPTKAPEKEKEEVKTSEKIEVASIKFPVLDSFNTKNITTNSWGDDENSIDAINSFHDYVPSVTGDPNTGLVDYGYRLIMSVLDSSSPNLVLTKNEDEKCYEITLFARLKPIDDDSTTKLNRDTLLMYCSLISSTPQKMYDIIYDSAEGSGEGVTQSYKTYGDFQIKYSITSDKKSITYSVKAK